MRESGGERLGGRVTGSRPYLGAIAGGTWGHNRTGGAPGPKCRWQRGTQGRSPGADKGTAGVWPIPARRGSSALGNRGLIPAGQERPGASPAAGMGTGFTRLRVGWREREHLWFL